jgi:protein-disulfide isomerase
MRSTALVILLASPALGPAACAGDPAGAHPTGRVHSDAPPVPSTRYTAPLSPATAGDEHALGGAEPLVTIVVFSDYACPPCARSWQVIDHLLEDYGDDLRVVFRSLTVPGFADGERAAEAAFAAGAQGRFWEMHRRLFQGEPRFDRPSLKAHAEALGLDVPRFLDDLDSGTHSARRIQHRRQAVELGIFFGPTALVNGRPVVGFRDEPSWHDLLDEEILGARAKLKAGTPRADLLATYQAASVLAPIELDAAAEAARKQLEGRFAADLKTLPKDFRRVEAGHRYQVEAGDAPTLGPVDAPVQLVAFMDFECPFCRKAAQEGLWALHERYPKDLQIAWRHLPLPIHRAAEGAARAAVAADRQGKFWPFAQRLLAPEVKGLGRSTFVAVARDLGLDEARFLADLDGPDAAAAVRDDMLLARRLGVDATPAFFLNGRHVSGFHGVEALAADIDAELSAAHQRLAEGVPRAELARRQLDTGTPPSQFPNADQ